MTPEKIPEAAAAHGFTAAVLTDHNTMSGAMAFLKACQKHSIRPVLGMEFSVRRNERLHPVVLIARNGQGLQNLYELASRLSLKEDSLALEDLRPYTQNCILLDAGGDDLLFSWALEENFEELYAFYLDLKQNSEQFTGSISLQEDPRWQQAARLFRLALSSLDIPAAALSRVEYEKPEDVETVQLMQAIQNGVLYTDRSLRVRKNRDFKTAQEMEALYPPEELQMTDVILEQIEEYSLEKAALPIPDNKLNLPSDEYLKRLALAGLRKRLNGQMIPVYVSRLQYELDVICSMGFADYFLIVYDYVREARKRKILAGPGRGSAAGSLVSWVLGISHVDPVANGLLFERFLNPERISMPDIDMDFPDDRRDEMIEYVQDRYGKGHAAQIVTYTMFKPKLALRDSARALGIPVRDVEKLTKLIDRGKHTSLKEALETSNSFASLVRNSRELNQLVLMAMRIEGLPKNTSIHAGGVVLSRNDIRQYAPLIQNDKALPSVGFTMGYLEELGLIKFDFLGIRYLHLMEQMKTMLEKQTGHSIDLFKLKLNDPRVYQLFHMGLTKGIFQMESEGITSLARRLQPVSFADLASILALYRPGPMKNIDSYLDVRFHRAPMQSVHPMLDGLLRETGGIFLYQEQIMEAARIIGGFSLSQADILRKAMSKKDHAIMDGWRQAFLEGAAQKGIPFEQAKPVFDLMERFADYGFNKSHSYAYGMIVYEMAWFKARHPLVFYAVSLNDALGSPEKLRAFLSECKTLSIPILPLDLNRSQAQWAIEGNGLRMPFGALRSLDKAKINALISHRDEHGAFDKPAMAILRLLSAGLKEPQIRQLIQTGAFDGIHKNREGLLASYERIASLQELIAWNDAWQSFEYAGVSEPSIEYVKEDPLQRIFDEKDAFGFYLSAHPAGFLKNRFPNLMPLDAAKEQSGWMEICGLVTAVHPHRTKKGDWMAFVSVEDEAGSLDLAVMPDLWKLMQDQIAAGILVKVNGRKNRPESMIPNRLEVWDPRTGSCLQTFESARK